MIGVLTESDAMAYCLSQGQTQDQCNAQIATQLVNGVWCDGDVSLTLDANGNHVATCVPQPEIDAKIAAIKADCLAHCGTSRGPALDAQCVPWCGGGTAYAAPSSTTTIAVVGVGLLALGLGLYLMR